MNLFIDQHGPLPLILVPLSFRVTAQTPKQTVRCAASYADVAYSLLILAVIVIAVTNINGLFEVRCNQFVKPVICQN